MLIHAHQTRHQVADFQGPVISFKDVLNSNAKQDAQLHVFPELFLTGYPLQDICLQKSFIKRYMGLLEEVNQIFLASDKDPESFLVLAGGLEYIYENESDELPSRIKNVVYEMRPGRKIKSVYTKRLLPNYDIFEEKKYYTKGESNTFISFAGKTLATLICEDMWHSTIHHIDPVEDIKSSGTDIDLVVNLSASPFNLYKNEKRAKRARYISNRLKAPFLYLNRVGGEDEILFDGGSFLVNGNEEIMKLSSFSPDSRSIDLPAKSEAYEAQDESQENTWEGLFSPDLIFEKEKLPRLRDLDEERCDEVIKALCFGVQEYAAKTGFSKFLIALSGGLDSALVLALLKLSLKPGQTLEAIYMPSKYSRQISQSASEEMCKDANIPFEVLPIISGHEHLKELFAKELGSPITGLTDENIQSRLRGLLLYARSNQTGALVINTSNKSELSVGYSTIYGDSVGALSLLGDLYKSEAYQLARHINKKHNGLIPLSIIERPPSAELRDDQVDTDSLPPYERMDAMLEGILSYRMDGEDLLKSGFDAREIKRVLDLYRKSEYKRGQFAPILKLKSKSYGFGYRVPITKNSNYLVDDLN